MISFLLPFVGAFAFCKFVLDWPLHAAEISDIALSTTSANCILAACFVTDLGTVMALGALFATYGWLLLVSVIVTAVSLFLLLRTMRLVIARVGHRVSQPEVKAIFVVLMVLGGLATAAGSEAALDCVPDPDPRADHTTLLMAIGLTFGSIAALFGFHTDTHCPAVLPAKACRRR